MTPEASTPAWRKAGSNVPPQTPHLLISYTTQDARTELELRAEIARLIHINAENSRYYFRMRRVIEWLESQEAIFTPELCWSPGEESFIDRVEALIALEEAAKFERERRNV